MFKEHGCICKIMLNQAFAHMMLIFNPQLEEKKKVSESPSIGITKETFENTIFLEPLSTSDLRVHLTIYIY